MKILVFLLLSFQLQAQVFCRGDGIDLKVEVDLFETFPPQTFVTIETDEDFNEEMAVRDFFKCGKNCIDKQFGIDLKNGRIEAKEEKIFLKWKNKNYFLECDENLM